MIFSLLNTGWRLVSFTATSNPVEQLAALAKAMSSSAYGEYLLQIAREKLI
jgi:hypothetical protein